MRRIVSYSRPGVGRPPCERMTEFSARSSQKTVKMRAPNAGYGTTRWHGEQCRRARRLSLSASAAIALWAAKTVANSIALRAGFIRSLHGHTQLRCQPSRVGLRSCQDEGTVRRVPFASASKNSVSQIAQLRPTPCTGFTLARSSQRI